jgi:hypothetical protein
MPRDWSLSGKDFVEFPGGVSIFAQLKDSRIESREIEMGEKMRSQHVLMGAVLAVLGGGSLATEAANILTPGDFIIAIDNNRNLPGTFTVGGGETPVKALDQVTSTKYLNFGREMTGLIVTPAAGSTSVQSFTLTTGGDAQERDPAAYLLYGTNSPITSTDNSAGTAEPWTLVQTGTLSLPTARQTVSSPINVTNAASYTSYKIVFNELRMVNNTNAPSNPNSMQIADIQYYTGANAGGTSITAPTDSVIGIDETDSAYPPNQSPHAAIDGDKTTNSKYLNFGREGSGLIITPSKGSTVAKAIQLTTANDTASRDPSHYELYGTNETIKSYENSMGDLENWSLISSGDITLPDARNVDGDIIPFDSNTTAYSSYKIIFTDNKGPDTGSGSANSIQFAEVAIYDSVPEPMTLGVMALGGVLLAPRRRRR